MWSFVSNAVSGNIGKRASLPECSALNSDCSDDEASSCAGREENLECPICWESFNLVENVPYVLWCGHTMCKNCILGLQWAVVKFPTVPLQMPLFVSCPWCNMLSPRLVLKGTLKFPRKNYFLLWMVESMNGGRRNSLTDDEHQPSWLSTNSRHSGHHLHAQRAPPNVHAATSTASERSRITLERIQASLRKLSEFFIQLTAKFPLVIIFLLIVVYAIPVSAAVLALYVLITVLFALPSFLILYFAYPSLDWLIREIFA